MITVMVKDDLERSLRLFRKLVERDGILKEGQYRRAWAASSDRNKAKARRAALRKRKMLARRQRWQDSKG